MKVKQIKGNRTNKGLIMENKRRIFLFMYAGGRRRLITSRTLFNVNQLQVRHAVDDMAGGYGYRQGDGYAAIVDGEGFLLDKLEFMP